MLCEMVEAPSEKGDNMPRVDMPNLPLPKSSGASWRARSESIMTSESYLDLQVSPVVMKVTQI